VGEGLGNSPKGGEVAMFRVAYGGAYFWAMANNMRESEAPRAKS